MIPLGVGLVWWPGLDALCRDPRGPVEVVELEPETFWRVEGDGFHSSLADALAGLAQPKLLHGVGAPFAGSHPAPSGHLAAFRREIARLGPAWISDHLAFNRVTLDGDTANTGIFLPPQQNDATVALAAANIRRRRAALRIPVAFETGVNYLKPRADEISDGDFFAATAEAADCGIVLDLHNLWCNERNGRAGVESVLQRLPLDRVWELHLAGGTHESGYWLDTHSGPVEAELLSLAARIVPRLPRLGAIIFEVMPEHLARIGLPAITRQLDSLKRLWELRPSAFVPAPKSDITGVMEGGIAASPCADPQIARYEAGFARLALGRAGERPIAAELARDPAIALYRMLAHDARRGMLLSALRLTVRLLLLSRERFDLDALMERFWRRSPPAYSAEQEAQRFLIFLCRETPDIPYLADIAAIEAAALVARKTGRRQSITLGVDPMPLLAALSAGRHPGALAHRVCEAMIPPP
jgi:uncharacterized protein (UPF0276 family)